MTRLKEDSGESCPEMAELFGVSPCVQWHKYIVGDSTNRRDMETHMHHNSTILPIVAGAIRRAALVPTECEALDIVGGALAAIAGLAPRANALDAYRRHHDDRHSYTATEARHA